MTRTTREAVLARELLDVARALEQGDKVRMSCDELREAAALLAEVEGLRRALKKYGQHEPVCDLNAVTLQLPCNCGFSAALAPSEEA